MELRLQRQKRWWIGLIGLIGLLAACSPANQALPTVAELPTVTAAEAAANPTAETNDERATLPPTWTPEPSATHTETPIASDTPTITPSMTITDTPSPTPTELPTIPPEERPRTSLLLDMLAAATGLPAEGFIASPMPFTQPTAAPPTADGSGISSPSVIVIGTSSTGAVVPTLPPSASGGTVTCPFFPPGGFGTVYSNNPDVIALIGCTSSSPPDVLSVAGAIQVFQQGTIIWLNGTIYVLKLDGTFRAYPDTYLVGTDPDVSSETPPSGTFSPRRGILKVWTQNTDVRPAVGWGVTDEIGAQATTLGFVQGMMIWFSGRPDILVLISSNGLQTGTWRSFAGQF